MNRYAIQVLQNWDKLQKLGYDYVRVDLDRVDELAEEHAFDEWPMPSWRFPVFPQNEWAFLAQVLSGNVFNAHYNIPGKPRQCYSIANPDDPSKPLTEAFAMWHRLLELGRGRPLKASDLAPHVETAEAMAKFFGGLPGLEVPAPELKAECGQDYVAGLESYFQGDPLNVVEEAMIYDEDEKRLVIRAFNKGRGLVEILIRCFPVAYGADIQRVERLEFPFHKRAMLNLLLMHGRAVTSGDILPIVVDIEEVVGIADYDVPNGQRFKGALAYNRELSEKVDSWREVSKGSPMEIMIRSGSTKASVRFRSRVNEKRERAGLKKIHICHDDFWWWLMGKNTGTFSHLTPDTSSY